MQTIAWTPEERSALVRQSDGDPACRCLVAVGGDGTVSALINERPRVPMSVLPAGTENLVAQHFGLRRNPEALADIIACGCPVRVDVGLAIDRRFLPWLASDLTATSSHATTVVASHGLARSEAPIGSLTSSRSCGRACHTGFRHLGQDRRRRRGGDLEWYHRVRVQPPRYALDSRLLRRPATTTAGSIW